MTEDAPSPPGQSAGAGEDEVDGGPGRADAALVRERPDRAAALAAGPTKVPRSFIVIALACVALLALGGAALDRAFPGTAGGSAAAGVVTTIGDYPPPFSVAGAGRADHPTGTVGPAIAGLPVRPYGPAKAHRDGGTGLFAGGQAGPADIPGRFSGTGRGDNVFRFGVRRHLPRDGSRVARGRTPDLGADAARVSFVTVNTDPLDLSVSAGGPAGTGSLRAVPTWQFLTGSLGQLDSVWRSYGVAVEIQRSTGTVSHNEVMYFIDTSGRVRDRATPFANETRSGVYTLSVPTETKWAAGVADQARYLLGGQR